VTYTLRTELGGFIPTFVVTGTLPAQLMYLDVMRNRFDRSAEVDRTIKERIVEVIRTSEDSYSEEEVEIVEEGMRMFGEFASLEIAKQGSNNAEIAHAKGDGQAWGWASACVRADPEQIVAQMWDVSKRIDANAENELTVDERRNDHNVLVHLKRKMMRPNRDRDFVSRCIWKRLENEEGFVVVYKQEESEKRRPVSGIVRGSLPGAMKMTKSKGATKGTLLEYVRERSEWRQASEHQPDTHTASL